MSAKTFDEHLAYWVDEIKIDRYRRALAEVVAPGATVLDLGSGTGLLGLLACEAGAGKVYAVDSGPIVAVAQDVFERNGVGDRVEILRGMSTEVTLPEAVDVIVGDQIGGFAYSAGVFEFYADAADRLLKPGGVTIPASFELFLAAVEHPSSREAIEPFGASPAGFDLGPVHQLVRNSMRIVTVRDEQPLLSSVTPVHSRAATDASRFRASARLSVARDGSFDGILGMFVATMSPGILMSNVPGHPDMMDRRWQDLFPTDRPIPVRVGDVVLVEITVNPATYLATWTITIEGPDGMSVPERHTTFEGQLLDSAQVRLLAGGPVRMTELGRATARAIAASEGDEIDIALVSSQLAAEMPHLQHSQVDRIVRGVASMVATGPASNGLAEDGACQADDA